MKLTFSPASPFARKVRIAAIELGLIDKIEFKPITVAPGQKNDEYSRITPLKKLRCSFSTMAMSSSIPM
jgi:glutathione S-transferase